MSASFRSFLKWALLKRNKLACLCVEIALCVLRSLTGNGPGAEYLRRGVVFALCGMFSSHFEVIVFYLGY